MVDGAMDALDRVAAVVLRLGDRVVVEHPSFPPLLDLLEQMGCDVVGVDTDDGGLDVEGLRRRARRRRDGAVPPAPGAEPGRFGDEHAAGQGARRGAGGHADDRGRGRPRLRDLHRAARQRRPVAPRADGARPQLLQEPRARSPTRRRRGRGRRGDGGRQPTAARAGMVEPHPAGPAARAAARRGDGRDDAGGRRARTPAGGRWCPACSPITGCRSPATTASTCGWRSPTSGRPPSPSPPAASASRPANRSSCAPTPTTSGSPSA